MPVRLSKLASNPASRAEGDWVPLGAEWEGIRVKTRRLSDAYQDMVSAKVRKSARGGNIADVKAEDIRRARHEALVAHVWVDVDGVTGEDEATPMPAADFFAKLIEPGYEELFEACAGAALRVGTMRADDDKARLGN